MFGKITLSLFITALFFYCLVTAPAFGQSAYSYADTWTDNESGITDQENDIGQVFVVGSGVTEIMTGSQAHEVNMQVELLTPSGRAQYGAGTWHEQSSGTSITVVVSIIMLQNPFEEGYFFTTTITQVTCPYEPGTSNASSSLPVVNGGSNTILYRYDREYPSSTTPWKTCYYKACANNDRNPPNGCFYPSYETYREVRNQSEACPAGVSISYTRYRIPLIWFSYCWAWTHHDLSFNPCNL